MESQKISSEELTAYLNQQLDARSLPEMASDFGYSQYYFSRLFKASMGMTLREYQSAIKIDRSISELAMEKSVIDAQLSAGYESAGTFSQLFKRSTGLSPNRYVSSLGQMLRQLRERVALSQSQAIVYRPYRAKSHQLSNPLQIHIQGRKHEKTLLFVALFPKIIAAGVPAFGVCLIRQNEYTLDSLPVGQYYVMVCEICPTVKSLVRLDSCQRDVCREPLHFPLTAPTTVKLQLRDKLADDPPILVNPVKLLFDVLNQKKP